ncbi:MAG: hypothetical protein LH702_21100 [Phormidesmis sp. CAN_BIN44]|nr:hypothetical protein [Phormidesmis sp. CAN_BIN44]
MLNKKSDRLHLGKRSLFYVQNLSPKIMNQITKPRPIPWTASPPKTQNDYPIVSNQGVNYQLVPLQLIDQLKAQNDNLIWLTVGLGALAAVACLSLLINALKPAQPTITVEKPVIVEREKLVPTACLLFCGK